MEVFTNKVCHENKVFVLKIFFFPFKAKFFIKTKYTSLRLHLRECFSLQQSFGFKQSFDFKQSFGFMRSFASKQSSSLKYSVYHKYRLS